MLAKYVAYIEELPSQAMFVDFHLDNKFNTSNTKCTQRCLGLHLYLGRHWI